MEKEYNARVRNKRDTEANWTANNPVLLDGEIVLVDMAAGGIRTKIGDGEKAFNDLDYSDLELRTLIDNCATKEYVTETINNTLEGIANGTY